MNDFFLAPVTFYLLIANIVISGYALFLEPGLIQRWGLRPYLVSNNGQWYRMVSGGFLHGGLMHLAFNMFTLYIFGRAIEQWIGSVRFAILYFGSLLVAHAFTLAFHRQDPDYNAVGASGAISGVLLSFCLFEPTWMLLIFGVIPVPSVLFAVGFIWYSVHASRSPQAGAFGNIAHEAHLGGGLAGIVITILMIPAVIGQFFDRIASFFQNLF